MLFMFCPAFLFLRDVMLKLLIYNMLRITGYM